MQAQNQGARVDFGYLSNLAVPDYKAKQAAFKIFTDSIENALTTDPDFIALQEKSKQINSADQALGEAAYKAELKKNELKNATADQVSAEYTRQFSGLNDMVRTLREVLGKSKYDFVALYEQGILQDYIFKNRQIQDQYGQQVYKCAVAKGKDSGQLDLMAKGSLSKAEMEIADALMADCKKELLDPFISDDADITAQVEEVMKD